MAGSKTFIMEELNILGGVTPPEGLARFEWTAANRNIPLQPWTFGVHQRTVRTDYPGADDPTEQVLGPQFTDFSLRGRFDDRYNINRGDENGDIDGQANRDALGGYAIRERAKLENMVRRGNVVRITFQDLTVQGIITDLQFDFRRSWDIGYSFTMSPHHRKPGGFFALKRSPRQVLNAKQLLQEVSVEVGVALTYHDRAPEERIVGTKFLDADALIASWVTGLASISVAIEQRGLTIDVDPGTALLRLAAAFLQLSTTAESLIDLLENDDSVEALDLSNNLIVVLDYDVWARQLMYQARRVVAKAQRAASELQQRAEPNAIALYRPQGGEHLYSVSNRFYRTPHNWRLIYERNGLTSTTLSGEELLVIPEVTKR